MFSVCPPEGADRVLHGLWSQVLSREGGGRVHQTPVSSSFCMEGITPVTDPVRRRRGCHKDILPCVFLKREQRDL